VTTDHRAGTGRRNRIDEGRQRQVNEAAEKFAGTIKDFYQTLPNRSISAQELNARLTEEFFSDVINNLRIQVQNNRALAGCDL
jgi:hypothetical protein